MRSILVFTSVLLVVVAGCEKQTGTSSVDPVQLERYQAMFSLDDEPPDVQGLEELRDKLIADNTAEGVDESSLTTTPVEVTVLGRIGGVVDKNNPSFPWEDGKASFVMCDPAVAAELAAHIEDHGGEDHDCPFCNKAKEKASLAQAYVQFQSNGETVGVDARKLFGLEGDELVVLQGKAKLTVGMLMVMADKIYVRQ